MPGGNGTCCRFRGSENSTVFPVVVSMLARISVSGRIPIRSAPASEPSSSTFTRGMFAHGFAGAAPPFAPPRVTTDVFPAEVKMPDTASRVIRA